MHYVSTISRTIAAHIAKQPDLAGVSFPEVLAVADATLTHLLNALDGDVFKPSLTLVTLDDFSTCECGTISPECVSGGECTLCPACAQDAAKCAKSPTGTHEYTGNDVAREAFDGDEARCIHCEPATTETPPAEEPVTEKAVVVAPWGATNSGPRCYVPEGVSDVFVRWNRARAAAATAVVGQPAIEAPPPSALAVWHNGLDYVVATSAEDAVAVFCETLGDRADLGATDALGYSAADWDKLGDGDAVTVNVRSSGTRRTLTGAQWVESEGRGLLGVAEA